MNEQGIGCGNVTDTPHQEKRQKDQNGKSGKQPGQKDSQESLENRVSKTIFREECQK